MFERLGQHQYSSEEDYFATRLRLPIFALF